MALFGRRKPGFSREVELKPSEIPNEFSDALDPAINRELDNPKLEKKELQEKAQQVMAGNVTAQDAQTPQEPGKVDLLDYMEALPDVEDPFTPTGIVDEDPEEKQRTRAQILGDFIRERSDHSLITARSLIAEGEEDPEELEKLIAEMEADESCKDICHVDGEKDIYYYSSDNMAHNYAKIAMLVTEKNIPRTMAEMVRFNCKAFPTPTPLYYFTKTPYFYTKAQMENALRQMQRDEKYKDICQFTCRLNGEPYLYSSELMSEKYALALADSTEAQEGDF
ncbi:MAG: hypothetical protein IJ083_17840 [Clostridia bacterium]|nr:hypothetical protein [Clostridia bacterium]